MPATRTRRMMWGGRARLRSGGLAALAVLCLFAIPVRPAAALPPEGVRLVEGEVVFYSGRTEPPYSVVTVRLKNDTDRAIEAVRMVMSFSSRPASGIVAAKARERVVELEPPLRPGEEREITLTEQRTQLHAVVKIAEVFPSLQVLLNGSPAAFEPPAFVWDGQIYAPVADVARALGWQVEWSEAWQAAAIISDSHAAVVQVGSGWAAGDGALLELGSGVRETQGKLIVPLRPVLEALGATVAHDGEAVTVRVSAPASVGTARVDRGGMGGQ